MQPPQLTTGRLVLRAATIADWPSYAAMWADERVTRFIGGEPRYAAVAWPKFVQGVGFWALLGYGYWTIEDHGGAFVGVGGFACHERGIPALEDFPECGWVIAPEGWGNGYASEAVAAMCAWADAAAIGETRCLIDDDNVASVRVAARIGYVPLAAIGESQRVFRRPAGAPA